MWLDRLGSAARRSGWIVAVVFALVAGRAARAQDVGQFEVFISSGVTGAVLLMSPPGEPERIMIGALPGVIYVVENGSLLQTPFLDIQDRVSRTHGLIGIAFPPDYSTTRRFYINYTALDADPPGPRIARYTTSENPNVANTDEEALIDHGAGVGDHNAGWMEFGPDGYLYVGHGDTSGDPQAPDRYQGKILRIDVSPAKGYAIPPDNMYVGSSGLPEIAAIGLRNPWRFAFDPPTGDLYIADVGESTQEEIDYVPAGTLVGRNFGWRCVEGTICRNQPPPCTCDPSVLSAPIHTYDHNGEHAAVIGGRVYRGAAIPRWRGRYFFLDTITARVWSFRVANGAATDLQEHRAALNEGLPRNQPLRSGISFGTDGNGEMYVIEAFGRILKIVPKYLGADWNTDGVVNSADFFAFLVDFFEGNADMTGDNTTTSADFAEYLRYFFES